MKLIDNKIQSIIWNKIAYSMYLYYKKNNDIINITHGTVILSMRSYWKNIVIKN